MELNTSLSIESQCSADCQINPSGYHVPKDGLHYTELKMTTDLWRDTLSPGPPCRELYFALWFLKIHNTFVQGNSHVSGEQS